MRGQLDGLVLSVLEEGPAHGYAIIERLRLRGDGVFEFAEGTVYPVLHRLEAAGSLAAEWATGTGRRRRVYRLSEQGVAALAVERLRWRRFAAAFDAVLHNHPAIIASRA